jgi:hypothetical protein
MLGNTAVSALPGEASKLTRLKKLSCENSTAPGATVRIPAAVFSALPLECTTFFECTRVEITGVLGDFAVVLPAALTKKGRELKNRDVLAFLAAFRGSATAALPSRLRAMVVGAADAGKTTVVETLASRRGPLGTLTRSARAMLNRRIVTFGVDVITWETDWPIGDGKKLPSEGDAGLSGSGSFYEDLATAFDESSVEIGASEGSGEAHITVTLYDFAGQPEYHPTHELFLAPDVLFVVVINLKTALRGDLSSIHAEVARVGKLDAVDRIPGVRGACACRRHPCGLV